MAEVVLEKVGKVYPDGTRAVDGLSLEVADGEFLVLVGPSGCGKTTSLRMVAGLEAVSEGVVRIAGRPVNDVPSRDRDVAMVFQSYALYPHLDVRDNIGFGLRLRRVPRDEVNRQVAVTAGMLGLGDFLGRRPDGLSGGQRQRVAMGRAMVREPAAFLMDEPLSNLDANLRVQMRAEIARITRAMAVTTIYVTHDQTEAMTLGHRVAVLRRGVLQQVAPPQELYDRPENLFVAGFIGSPAMNLVQGTLRRSAEGGVTDVELTIGTRRLPVPDRLLRERPRLARYLDRPVAIGVRPEDLTEVGRDAPARTWLVGVAELVEALGSDLLVHLQLDADPVVTEDTRELGRDAGRVGLGAARDAPAGTELVARFSPRSRVREGDAVRVAVDVDRLHVFDLTDGRAIW